MRTNVTVLIVLLLPLASAHHLDRYGLKYVCAESDGRSVEADCTVGGDYSASLPASRFLSPFAIEVEADTRPVVYALDPPGIPVDVMEGNESYLSSSKVLDPLLEEGAKSEVEVKSEGFDAIESTGVHARLICGWNLTETARTCSFYNPESESEWSVVRRERDDLLERGWGAYWNSTFENVEEGAPSLDVRLRYGSFHLHVDDEGNLGLFPSLRTSPPSSSSPLPLWASPSLGSPLPLPSKISSPEGPLSSSPSLSLLKESGSSSARVEHSRIEPSRLDPTLRFLWGLGISALLALGAFAHRYLSERNVLEHPLRKRILEHVQSDPGISISEVARFLGVSHTTTTYHVEVLLEAGFLSFELLGNRKHLFPRGTTPSRAERIRIALSRLSKAGEIYAQLLPHEEIKASDLARRTGLTTPGAIWHLKRLERWGIVERRGKGYVLRSELPGTSLGS